MTLREDALTIIYDTLYGENFSADLISEKRNNYDTKDFNLLQELVLGTLRHSLYLEYVLKSRSKIPFRKIDKYVLNILKMAFYQVLFLDRVPDYAVVNESVNLAKKYANRGAAGFVNGVLRSFLRDGNKIEVKEKDRIKHLSIVYSVNEELTKYFVDRYGYEFTEEMFKSLLLKTDVTVRVNTLKGTTEKFESIMSSEGFKYRKGPLSKTGYMIDNPNGLFTSKAFKEGYFYAQNESSILVGEALDPKEGEKVLDMCAAPGGKTTHISALMNNTGEVLALDVSDKKVSKIKENAARLGAKNIKTFVQDGTVYNELFLESFDKVLVDAPCSALGLMRRYPEIKLKKSVEDIIEISNIQLNIILNAAKYLKNGGKLVYSTCTITSEENEKVIDEFLKRNKNFKIEKFEDKNFLRIFPQEYNTDGFTIWKLIKCNI